MSIVGEFYGRWSFLIILAELETTQIFENKENIYVCDSLG